MDRMRFWERIGMEVRGLFIDSKDVFGDKTGGDGGAGGGTGNAAAPQFVTKDEFQQLQQVLTGQAGMFNQLNENLNKLAENLGKPTPAAVVPVKKYTDEEIQQAIDEGKGPAVIRQMMNTMVQEAVSQLRQEHIDPLRDTGLDAISRISKDSIATKLPHFKRFEKEIDAHIAKLPPAVRANPDVYAMAYNMVVGQNAEVLIKEAKEAALRGAGEGGAPLGDPGGRGNGGGGGEKIPTVTELLGADAAQALEARKITPDEHARRLGHKDWESYTKFVKEQAVA